MKQLIHIVKTIFIGLLTILLVKNEFLSINKLILIKNNVIIIEPFNGFKFQGKLWNIGPKLKYQFISGQKTTGMIVFTYRW